MEDAPINSESAETVSSSAKTSSAAASGVPLTVFRGLPFIQYASLPPGLDFQVAKNALQEHFNAATKEKPETPEKTPASQSSQQQSLNVPLETKSIDKIIIDDDEELEEGETKIQPQHEEQNEGKWKELKSILEQSNISI